MLKSARLRLSDVRSVHRLVGECRELGDDPAVWRGHLARGLAGLAGAALVSVAEAPGGRPEALAGIADSGWAGSGLDRAAWEAVMAEYAARPDDLGLLTRAYRAVFEREDGAARTRADLVPDRVWGRSEVAAYVRATGAGAQLFCDRRAPAAGTVAMAVLVRPAGEPDFGGRDRALAAEAQAQVAPLVGGPLASFADPAPSALPPRARRVLRCLLEGDSDKQAAARLGVRPLTVNQHTKLVYRHFGVGGRAELLARWVRRGWGGRAAWADD